MRYFLKFIFPRLHSILNYNYYIWWRNVRQMNKFLLQGHMKVVQKSASKNLTEMAADTSSVPFPLEQIYPTFFLWSKAPLKLRSVRTLNRLLEIMAWLLIKVSVSYFSTISGGECGQLWHSLVQSLKLIALKASIGTSGTGQWWPRTHDGGPSTFNGHLWPRSPGHIRQAWGTKFAPIAAVQNICRSKRAHDRFFSSSPPEQQLQPPSSTKWRRLIRLFLCNQT